MSQKRKIQKNTKVANTGAVKLVSTHQEGRFKISVFQVELSEDERLLLNQKLAETIIKNN